MLQTLIASIIVVLAAIWVLKNAYAKINPSQEAPPTCGGCSCSGCQPSANNQMRCDGYPLPPSRSGGQHNAKK